AFSTKGTFGEGNDGYLESQDPPEQSRHRCRTDFQAAAHRMAVEPRAVCGSPVGIRSLRRLPPWGHRTRTAVCKGNEFLPKPGEDLTPISQNLASETLVGEEFAFLSPRFESDDLRQAGQSLCYLRYS